MSKTFAKILMFGAIELTVALGALVGSSVPAGALSEGVFAFILFLAGVFAGVVAFTLVVANDSVAGASEGAFAVVFTTFATGSAATAAAGVGTVVAAVALTAIAIISGNMAVNDHYAPAGE